MTPSAGWYIEKTDKATNHKVYGPFPSQDAAVKARFLNLTEQELEASRKQYQYRNVMRASFYTEGELDGIMADVGAFGYKTMKVVAARYLKRDARWDEHDATSAAHGRAPFSETYFVDSFKHFHNRAPV